MGTENHNVVSFNANTLAKGTHGVIVAIYCTKEHSGAKLEVINGLNAAGTVEFEVYGSSTHGTCMFDTCDLIKFLNRCSVSSDNNSTLVLNFL